MRGQRSLREKCPPTDFTGNTSKLIYEMVCKQKPWDHCIPIPEFSKKVCHIVIGVAAFLCYVNSLDGDFVFDDSEAIVNNPDMKLSTPILQMFRNDFWGTQITHNASHKSYRPLTVLSFRFNAELSGGVLVPFAFRITNLVLHTIMSCLMMTVYHILYGLRVECQKMSFISALLFAVHPVHTEAVAGIVGRADLLCALFSMCTFLVYSKAAHSSSFKWNVVYTSVAIVLAAVAMFCKEQGISVIGICSAYDLLIVQGIYPTQLYTLVVSSLKTVYSSLVQVKNGDIKSSDQRINKYPDTVETQKVHLLLTRHVLLTIAGVFLMILRWNIMGRTLPVFQTVDNPASFAEGRFIRVVNYIYVYALNMWLLICPVWLCFDWSMGCIPLITGDFHDVRLLAVFAFLSAGTAVLLNFVFGRKTTKTRITLVSLAVIIIPFLPATNLFFRVGFVVAERVLYIPSIGFCMLIGLGIRQLSTLYCARKFIRPCLVCLIIVLFTRSCQRSLDWRTEHQLFRSAVSVCPLNAKVHYNLGKTADDRTTSIQHYKEAIRLNPEYDQAMNNLANIFKDEGKLNEAELLLRRAVHLRSDFAAAWMNLGIVLSNKKQYEEAEKCYYNALRHRKKYPDCLYNLGNLYLEQKKYAEAYKAWHRATVQKPEHKIAWNNMIVMLDSIGEHEKAVDVGVEALSAMPTEPAIHFNFANTLGKLKRYREAESHFKEAITLKPDQAVYYVNLGVLYHNWKKLDLARSMYLRALQLDPKSKSAKDNLAMLGHRITSNSER